MTYLSELASRILAELDEAHAENVTSTMNTVFEITGDASELLATQDAIKELVEASLVGIAYEDPSIGKLALVSKQQALADIESFGQLIEFRVADKLWIWKTEYARAEIVATEAGLSKAGEILANRGYQWWFRNA